MGVANAAAGFTQGLPVGASGSRTAVNDAMGARSQIAGLLAAARRRARAAVPHRPDRRPAEGRARRGDRRRLRRADRAAAVARAVAHRPRRAAIAGDHRPPASSSIGVLRRSPFAVALSIVDVVRRSARPHDAVLGWVDAAGPLGRRLRAPRARASRPGSSSTGSTTACSSPTPATSRAACARRCAAPRPLRTRSCSTPRRDARRQRRARRARPELAGEIGIAPRRPRQVAVARASRRRHPGRALPPDGPRCRHPGRMRRRHPATVLASRSCTTKWPQSPRTGGCSWCSGSSASARASLTIVWPGITLLTLGIIAGIYLMIAAIMEIIDAIIGAAGRPRASARSSA